MNKYFSILVLIFSCHAKAWIFIEPSVGSEKGTSEIKYTQAGALAEGVDKLSGDTQATTLGLKMGYQSTAGPWFAVAVQGSFTGEIVFPSNQFVYERSLAGFDFGYRFGRLNIYLGYSPLDQFVLKQSSSDSITYSGFGTKLGFGVLVISHVSLNFEYVMHTFDQIKDDPTAQDQFKANVKAFAQSGSQISLSFPF